MVINEEILFEKGSVSEIVIAEANRVKSVLLGELRSTDSYMDYSVPRFARRHKRVELDLSGGQEVFGTINKIVAQVVYFDSNEDMKENFSKFKYRNYTDFNNSLIYLSFYGIGEEENQVMLNSMLFHEVHHVFQQTFYGKSKIVGDLYKKATEILEGGLSKYSQTVLDLAKIIYFFDKREVDANMQSLYQELVTNNNENGRVMNDFYLIEDILNFYSSYSFSEELQQAALDAFNTPLKKLLNYAKHREKYFIEKSKNVFNRFREEQDERKQNEGIMARFCGIYS